MTVTYTHTNTHTTPAIHKPTECTIKFHFTISSRLIKHSDTVTVTTTEIFFFFFSFSQSGIKTPVITWRSKFETQMNRNNNIHSWVKNQISQKSIWNVQEEQNHSWKKKADMESKVRVSLRHPLERDWTLNMFKRKRCKAQAAKKHTPRRKKKASHVNNLLVSQLCSCINFLNCLTRNL